MSFEETLCHTHSKTIEKGIQRQTVATVVINSPSWKEGLFLAAMWDILKEAVAALLDLPQHFFTIDGGDANLFKSSILLFFLNSLQHK